MTTINQQLTADWEQETGTNIMNGTGAALDMHRDDIGLHGEGFAIPPGSTINSAVVRFVASASDSGTPVDLLIYAQADADPADFSSSTGAIDALALTTEFVDWESISAWVSGNTYDSPDISLIIQELIDLPGWASGNNINIIIFGNDVTAGGQRRRAKSLEHTDGATDGPRLVIDFTEPAGGNQEGTVTFAGELDVAFAAISGAVGAVTAAGERDVALDAQLAVGGAVTAAGERDVALDAQLAVGGAVTAAGERDVVFTAIAGAVGAVTAAGQRSVLMAASVGLGGGLTAALAASVSFSAVAFASGRAPNERLYSIGRED